MSPRKQGPVLFELVRDSPRSTSGGPGPVATDTGGSGGMLNWAGRTVRVPAGYIFVVAAVIATAGILGYVIGFGRAEQVYDDKARQQAQLGADVTDPLDSGPVEINLTAPQPEAPALQSRLSGAAGDATDRDTSSRSTNPAQTGRDESSRQPGLNYYVLVRDLPAEGDRLVAWLDTRGIPALTEPVSGGLVKVIVLQGFERGQASSARALSYKQHLRELGARWKREHGGSSDFSDLYLEKYSN